MVRLSKLTDYGILILSRLARMRLDADPGGALESSSCNARALAQQVELPLPMVSKVLKSLTRAGLLDSQRGAQGGYSLARRPEDISVSEIIAALEGPLALTECSAGPHVCDLEATCQVRSPLLVINLVVQNALAGITLRDVTNPGFAEQFTPLGDLARIPLHDPPSLAADPLHHDDTLATSYRKEN